MSPSLGRILPASLRGPWKRGRRSSPVVKETQDFDVCQALEAEKEALAKFCPAMETEFLELGSNLGKIASLGREIRDRCNKVMAATSGHSEDAAIQFAFQLLKKAEDLVQASREQHDTVIEVFENINHQLIKAGRERNDLMRSLSPLATTTVQFRIQVCAFEESTRTQFFLLAQAVEGIVRDVQAAIGESFQQLEDIGSATGLLAAQITTTTAAQKTETANMLSSGREQLGELNDVLTSSEAVALSLSQWGARITSGVSKAIVALQCQDRARQKVAHISSAIDNMLDHLAASNYVENDSELRIFLAGAARIQLGQSKAVFEDLQQAAAQISDGLQDIAREAALVTDHAVRSGDAALNGQIIGHAVDSIHAVLKVIQEAVSSISCAAWQVQRLKETFSDCTSQTFGLALRLRMVALNAQIFAAHVDGGAALEVIAENTRRLADQAMAQLDDISGRVTSLINLVVDLEQRIADHRELASIEQSHLVLEAGQAEQRLRQMQDDLRNAVSEIGPLERELSNRVGSTAESIIFPRAVAEASARSTALFERIIARFGDLAANGTSAAHLKVQELKLNYTMADERMVHESAVDAPPGLEDVCHPAADGPLEIRMDSFERLAEPPFPDGMDIDEDGLAANVELF